MTEPLSELTQDEIADEFLPLYPEAPDPGGPVEDVTKREPEIAKKPRGFPKGRSRPERAKDGEAIYIKCMAADCLEYLRFLVANGNATGITDAIEQCIRDSRAAQRLSKE